jgi:hypothetical protein
LCFSTPRLPMLLYTVQPNFLFCTESHSYFWQNSLIHCIVQQLGQSLVSVVLLLEHKGSGPVTTA